MLKKPDKTEEFCGGCVYYPPNLPPHAYAQEDWSLLQSKSCSFDLQPGDDECLTTRKTSCSLVDLEKTKPNKL